MCRDFDFQTTSHEKAMAAFALVAKAVDGLSYTDQSRVLRAVAELCGFTLIEGRNDGQVST